MARKTMRTRASATPVTAGAALRTKLLVVAAVLLTAVVALVTAILGFPFRTDRETTLTPPPSTAHSLSSARPARPALTAAEEQYIRELWPIHGDVERNTMRMSLGQIFYKTQDLGGPELKIRVEQALAAYRDAEARLRALEPPASLRSEHEEYLFAIRLFEASAVEVLKMFKDGREDHLLAAYPKSQEGSNKIREVGGKFWPNEFPPH
jgi:hypothetical protein